MFVPALLTAAGIKVFSFVSPLPKPYSYAGIAIGIWALIGIIYMIYLYARDPKRLEDTKKVFEPEDDAQVTV